MAGDFYDTEWRRNERGISFLLNDEVLFSAEIKWRDDMTLYCALESSNIDIDGPTKFNIIAKEIKRMGCDVVRKYFVFRHPSDFSSWYKVSSFHYLQSHSLK